MSLRGKYAEDKPCVYENTKTFASNFLNIFLSFFSSLVCHSVGLKSFYYGITKPGNNFTCLKTFSHSLFHLPKFRGEKPKGKSYSQRPEAFAKWRGGGGGKRSVVEREGVTRLGWGRDGGEN